MNKNCPNCKLVNFPNAETCSRCGLHFIESQSVGPRYKLLKRTFMCLLVTVFALVGFYASLVFSAKSLSYDERKNVASAIAVLEAKNFSDEVFLLRHIAVFRSNDNWLNASIEKENAFAATNFPFEIVTLYPDFFMYPLDDIERAAILLHEAKHMQGKDEKESYEFVWRNKNKLGWNKEQYKDSVIWQAVRTQTLEYSPSLFVCDANHFGDCTE